MIYLFIHQNAPAQYRHLARHFADQPDNSVYFITQRSNGEMPGVTTLLYSPEKPDRGSCHPFTYEIDAGIRTGIAVTQVCRSLLKQGVQPDIVIGHNGWGETLFVKDVFPDVPLLAYFEFFYHYHGVDVGFDPEFATIFGDPMHLRTRNAINLMGFDAADWGNTPTHWQRSVYPPEMRRRISVIHEGVDTELVKPDVNATFRVGDTVLTRNDEVITYVARNLEPYRGFHIFMRALAEIQQRRPHCHALVVGGDGVSYGYPALPGTTYRENMLRELGGRLDLARIHFLGQVPYETYLDVLQVSSTHIYLTYPFVLSWSFIEALAAGCVVIGSRTPPVLEVLAHKANGLTVDFFSPLEIADEVDQVMDAADRLEGLRQQARATAVRHFDLKTRQLPRWERLIGDVIAGRRPQLDYHPR
jgi:glycosyltransferase involved in cell wall biosynthesis